MDVGRSILCERLGRGFTQPKSETVDNSPLAVSSRARDGLDLEVEAPPLFPVFLLDGDLAVEGTGGTQFGQALVLVSDGDLERQKTASLPFWD